MQLRKSIKIPTRLEDEEPVTPNNRNGTKPAHPALMKAAVIPFNPANPPAAFPSLPLTSKAAPVADRYGSGDAGSGASEAFSSLPTQTSLAGKSSEDAGEEQSQDQTCQINLKDEQDSIRQDETSESATECEVVCLTSSLTAKSSTTGTQTGNTVDHTIEQDKTQRHESPANVAARETVSPNKAKTSKSSTGTTQTESTINLTPRETATQQDGRSDNVLARPPAGQTQPNARSASGNTRFIGKVAWRDLSLSMQYRIFKAVSARHPSDANHAVQALGLTEIEAAQIRHAVGARAMHPASLDEIWDHCLSISTPIPGLQNQLSMDRDIFNAYQGYMVFVAHYDFATQAKVRLAEEFLSERQLPSNLMGTWASDPTVDPGFGVFIPVPTKQAAPGSAPAVSASSSCAVQGPGAARTFSSGQEQEDNTQSSAPIPAWNQATHKVGLAEPTLLADLNETQFAARNARFHPVVHRRIKGILVAGPAQVIEPVRTKQTRSKQTVARHPLATVSMPGEVQTPPRTRQGVCQTGLRLRSGASLGPVATPDDNILAQAALSSGLKSGDMPGDVRSSTKARNAVKDTTTTASSAQAKHAVDIRDKKGIAEALQPTSSPTLSSQRLVLKVHQEDGLARVFRKSPLTSDLRHQTETPQSVSASSGISNASETAPPALLQFGTTMGNFTRKLGEVPPTSGPMTFHRTRDTLVPRIQDNDSASLTDSTAITISKLKRKPSQSDIRPDTSKMPRTEGGLVSTTPPRGLVHYNVHNVERLHSEGKQTGTANILMNISSENNAPTQGIKVVPIGKAMEGSNANVNSPVQGGATTGSFPPSPSFSAISENEDLPEYQALLEPVKHRLCAKAPASSKVTALDPANVVSNPHLHLLQGIAKPGPSASGEATSDSPTTETKKKRQTLKLIVGVHSYDAKPSNPVSAASPGPATAPAKKGGEERGMYKKTRERKAQDQREYEEALVARAAGISPMKK